MLTASSMSSIAISKTMRFLRFRKIPMMDSANSMAPKERKCPSVTFMPVSPNLHRQQQPVPRHLQQMIESHPSSQLPSDPVNAHAPRSEEHTSELPVTPISRMPS